MIGITSNGYTARNRIRVQMELGAKDQPFVTSVAILALCMGHRIALPSSWEFRIWLLVYVLVAFLLLMSHLRLVMTIPVSVSSIALWSFMALVMISQTRSLQPSRSLFQIGGLLGTTLVGIWLAVNFRGEALPKLFFSATTVVVFLSILTMALLPSVAIDTTNVVDGVKGVLDHKNSLGKSMAMYLGVAFILARWRVVRRSILVAGGASALVLLVLSNSREGWLTAIVLIVLTMALPRRSIQGRRILAIFFSAIWCLAFLSIILVANTRVISGFFDDYGTGRTRVWSLTFRAAREKIWFGYGYGGFWGTGDSPAAVYFPDTWFVPYHAHNLLLEVTLSVGMIGAILFALCLVSIVWCVTQTMLSRPSAESHFAFLVVTTILFQSIVSVPIPRPEDIRWMLFVAIVIQASSSTRLGSSKNI